MKLKRLLAVPIAGIALFSASTQIASAHDTSASLYDTTGYRVGYGGVTNDHQRLYSCDTSGDGYGFRAEYKLKQGQTGYVDDANGSTSGCSGIYPAWGSNPIAQFRVIWKQSGEWHYSSWKTA